MEISEVEMKKTLLSAIFLISMLWLLILGASADVTSPDVISLRIESYPARTVYGAFESFDPTGLSVVAEMSDGSKSLISSSQLAFNYEGGDSFRVGDEHVTISYGGRVLHLPVTVNPIGYSIDTTVCDVTLTYNGRYQSYTAALPTIIGLDGIPLEVRASGGGTKVGEYEVFIDFTTESKNYLIPESRVVKLIIEPMETSVIWSDLSFVYDGKSKKPTAEYIDALGKSVELSVLGGATNAGSYTARVGNADPNYKLLSTTAEYEIKKADYDMSGVSWNGTSFVYDGSKRSVTLFGLPKGVRVIGYDGDVASDAGKYTATATLSWDNSNYNAPILRSHSWEILPADYDLSGFRFLPSTHTFDGNTHYPTLEGRMPIGADGIPLEYSYSTGATHVSDGKVSVIVSFKTKSKNYNTPAEQYSSVSITPLGINVVWSSDKLYYTGEKQSPTATAEECTLRVNGGALTVGKYVATAESRNSDYYVINDRCEYEILKAQNSWRVSPAASTCYEGREIKLVGESRFGEVKYSFFADPNGTEKISSPTVPGKYYARLTVEESMNYFGLTSNLIPFEIVKIAPVSFVATIGRDGLLAFDKILAGDLVCLVVNNDGSRESVDSSFVEIVYQNGDSLRRNDSSVTLIYDKFSLTLPITVGFAAYDMSGVRWEKTSLTYSGTALTPTIVGLPDGVSVISYSVTEMINAGSYTVTPELSYDSENYAKPTVPSCIFTIEKKAIAPGKITTEYNGKYQTPTTGSLLYTVDSDGVFREAGSYAVTLRLTDSRNYVFAGTGGDSINGIYEILPATIGVKVKDTRLHLFEKLSGAEYYITSGGAYGDDYVGLGFYLEDGRVYALSQNPNYVLKVESGRLTRLPYPTLEDSFWIVGALLLLLLIFVGIYFLYKNRGKLAVAVGIVKCRMKHRHFTVADPIDEPRVTSMPQSEEKTVNQSTLGDEKISIAIDEGHADMLITDSQAKSLVKKEGDVIYTHGSGRAKISVGELSDAFGEGETVDVNSLKEKGIVSPEVAYIKIISGGKIDKSLIVFANDFTLSAVKMIALSGGQAIKSLTMKGRAKEKK